MTVSAHNPGLPPIIELNSVIKEFGSYRAVDELSFTVAKGEIVALLGRTGAGRPPCSISSWARSPPTGAA